MDHQDKGASRSETHEVTKRLYRYYVFPAVLAVEWNQYT